MPPALLARSTRSSLRSWASLLPGSRSGIRSTSPEGDKLLQLPARDQAALDQIVVVAHSSIPPAVPHSEIDAHKKTSHFSCPRNGRQFKVGKGFFSSMKESELPSYAGDKIPCEYTSFRLMRRSADEVLGPHKSGATDTEKQGTPRATT